MSILIIYYAFLIVGPVLLAVTRDSPMVEDKRNEYLGFVLAPPLLLILQTWNLSFFPGVVLLVAFAFLVDRVRRARKAEPTTPATFGPWLTIWSIELVLPLAIHFALRMRPELERGALLIAGMTLLAGTLFTFLRWAPDLRKRA